MKSKKGYTLKDITPIALLVVVSVLALSIGSDVLISVQEDQCIGANTYNQTANRCYAAGAPNDSGMSAAGNVTYEGLKGTQELGSWIPTIALVVAAAIVIGVLVVSFSRS